MNFEQILQKSCSPGVSCFSCFCVAVAYIIGSAATGRRNKQLHDPDEVDLTLLHEVAVAEEVGNLADMLRCRGFLSAG